MKLMLSFVMFLSFLFPIYAQTTAFTKDEMIKLVDEAAKFAKENGKNAAIEEFQKKDGKFFKHGGELYIFAYEFDGTNLALPTKPQLKGKNLIGLQDANGVPFVQKLIEVAKKGKGEFEYNFENPATKKVEKKIGYVIGMDGWMLGSGIYTK